MEFTQTNSGMTINRQKSGLEEPNLTGSRPEVEVEAGAGQRHEL